MAGLVCRLEIYVSGEAGKGVGLGEDQGGRFSVR